MTFTHIQTPRDFARIDGVNWFLDGCRRTLEDLAEGKMTLEQSTTALATEIADLAAAAEGPITLALARRLCETLGYTLARTMNFDADATLASTAINDTVDDFDATIAALLTGEVGTSAELVAGMRRLLKSAAQESWDGVAAGEHFGDLFLAAADAVVVAQERA